MDNPDPKSPGILITDDEFGGFRVQMSSAPAPGWWWIGWFFLWGGVVVIPCCLFGSWFVLVIWAAIGLILMLGFISSSFSWEVFQIIEKQVRLQRGIGTWVTFTREFNLSEVRDLRFTHIVEGVERLTLTCKKRIYPIGSRLSHNDQLRLLKTIKSRFTIPDDDESAGVEPFSIQT